MFETETYAKVFEAYELAVKDKRTLDQQYFLNHEDSAVSELCVDLVFSPYTLSENWKQHQIVVETEGMSLRKAVERTVYSLKMAAVKKMIAENGEKLSSSEDDSSREDLLKEYAGLKEAHKYIAKVLGRVVN